MRNQGLDGKLLVSPPAMVAKSAKRFMSMDVLRKVPEPSQRMKFNPPRADFPNHGGKESRTRCRLGQYRRHSRP